jgi:hypothetical protein
MKDDIPESSSGAASQKSVTDWLMQVISGKAPTELHLDADAEKPHAVAESQKQPQAQVKTQEQERAGTAVAVADMPRRDEPATIPDKPTVNGSLDSEITAEDLCGAPAYSVIMPQIERQINEITADDVCWVPMEKRIKPEPIATLDILKAPDEMPGPPVKIPEEPERTITAEDISREISPYSIEAQKNGHILHEPEPEIEEAVDEHTITAEDITREPVVLPSEPPLGLEDIFREPDIRPEAQTGEPEHHETETESIQTAEPVIELPSPDTTEDAVTVEGPREPEAVEPEPEHGVLPGAVPVELADAGETEVSRIATGAAEVLVPEAEGEVEPEARAAQPQESIFAREGIWAEPRRETIAAGDVYQNPAYRERERLYPTADELREFEKIRPEGWNSAWRTLLAPVLPWIARVLPMLESSALSEQSASLTQEVRHEVAGLRMVQYEIKTAVQEHSVQLKRIEEQLGRVRESVGVAQSDDLAESVRTTAKLVQWIGIGLGGLVVVLIVMVIVLLARGH